MTANKLTILLFLGLNNNTFAFICIYHKQNRNNHFWAGLYLTTQKLQISLSVYYEFSNYCIIRCADTRIIYAIRES